MNPTESIAVFQGLGLPWYSPGGIVARVASALGLVREMSPEAVDFGADYGSGGPAAPTYDPKAALSAMAAFPWVYAAIMRASSDLAKIPLQVQEGRGRRARILDTHPLYDLIDRPSPRVSGRQFRRQLYVDLKLTGNAISGIVGSRNTLGLIRLHPARITIEPDRREAWGDYLYNTGSGAQRWSAEDIAHVRAPSWEDDPRGLWGTGAIQALNDDLTTDRRASKATAALSKRGRPDIVLSPADKDTIWNQKVREGIKARIDQLLEGGGTVVLGGGAKLETPTFSPRDLEFPKLRDLVVQAVLAVTGVPPHLVGLPTANYAQAREQTLVYWELLEAIAEDISDALWNPVARRYGPGLYIVHDFSGVDALQRSRDARQKRAQNWWFMGMSARDAAAYEGFEDAPFTGSEPEKAEEEPIISAAGIAAIGSQLWRQPQKDAADPRDTAWRDLMEKAHTPSERAIWRAMSSALRAQRSRVVKALTTLTAQRAEGDPFVVLDLIWNPAEENAAVQQAIASSIARALDRAFVAGVEALPVPGEIGFADAEEIARENAARTASLVNTTTRDRLGAIVEEGMANDLPMADIVAQLEDLPEFTPARALRVARTESTRLLTIGQREAWKHAEVEFGLTIKQVWLSSRDDLVRKTHELADKQTRSVGELFDVGTATGPGPGEMSEASENINCRCTLLPEVIE